MPDKIVNQFLAVDVRNRQPDDTDAGDQLRLLSMLPQPIATVTATAYRIAFGGHPGRLRQALPCE